MEKKVIRIIDANGNRAREGLRVCEDFARFSLGEERLARGLKEARHRIAEAISSLPLHKQDLLSSRESERDFGRRSSYDSNSRPQNLSEVVFFNLRRSQEACRVLEEVTFLMDRRISNEFKKTRFDLYQIEKEMMITAMKNERSNIKNQISRKIRKFDPTLIAITDMTYAKGRSQEEMMKSALKGGVTMVQLRDEKGSTREVIELAKSLGIITKKIRIPLLINDRVDIALVIGADGVHLGEEDMDPRTARRLLVGQAGMPVPPIIGVSVRSPKQAKDAEKRGADYVAVGSIFPSETKRDAKVVGLSTLRSVKKTVHVPVIAIGGINLKNLPKVLETGVDGVAVIQGLLDTENIEERARKFKDQIEKFKN